MSLNSRYSAMYNAQLNPLEQERDSAIQSANQNINSVNNQYKNIYAALDKQAQQAGDVKYKGLNDADTTVNQNLNRVQEIMAKNGWLGGGENLQTQLDSNSDRSNRHGEIEDKYSTALENLDTQRNEYQAEQNLKLQSLYDAIQAAKNNYGKNAAALEQSLYGQQQNDYAKAAQQAAARTTNQQTQQNSVFQDAITSAQQWLAQGKPLSAWVQGNRSTNFQYLTPEQQAQLEIGGPTYQKLLRYQQGYDL